MYKEGIVFNQEPRSRGVFCLKWFTFSGQIKCKKDAAVCHGTFKVMIYKGLFNDTCLY